MSVIMNSPVSTTSTGSSSASQPHLSHTHSSAASGIIYHPSQSTSSPHHQSQSRRTSASSRSNASVAESPRLKRPLSSYNDRPRSSPKITSSSSSTISYKPIPVSSDAQAPPANATTKVDTVDAEAIITSPTKKLKPKEKPKKIVPKEYSKCSMDDLVVLISDMLNQLVTLNDGISLTHGGLTRFHSRAPPTISITDYLHRISHHTTLEPSTLLSMIYYIDLLSNHYPSFTISSLTVHRFLITAATVASKGLCDSFCTNAFYARVGGVSLRELNVLELEFLGRVGWKIVPQAEILCEYYQSLVRRMGDGWEIESEPANDVKGEGGRSLDGSLMNDATAGSSSSSGDSLESEDADGDTIEVHAPEPTAEGEPPKAEAG